MYKPIVQFIFKNRINITLSLRVLFSNQNSNGLRAMRYKTRYLFAF
jgi:hypothetical protein